MAQTCACQEPGHTAGEWWAGQRPSASSTTQPLPPQSLRPQSLMGAPVPGAAKAEDRCPKPHLLKISLKEPVLQSSGSEYHLF